MSNLFKIYDENEFSRACAALESFGFTFSSMGYNAKKYIRFIRINEKKGYVKFLFLDLKTKTIHHYSSEREYRHSVFMSIQNKTVIFKSLDDFLLSNRCPRMLCEI